MMMLHRACTVAALLAFTASCAPSAGFTVVHAKERGTFQAPHVVGRDGGASFLSRAAGDVWIFGDTFIDVTDGDGSNFHSSSFNLAGASVHDVLTGPLTAPADQTGAPQPFLTATDDERAFNLAHQQRADGTCAQDPCGGRFATWPGTTIAIGDDAFTFYNLIHADVGDFNFQGVGQSIATWSLADAVPHPARPVLGDAFAAHPTALFGADEPGFGAAAAVDGDFVYAWACDLTGLSVPCLLGRVQSDEILARSRWTFFDGTAFVDDVHQAKGVFDGAPILTVQKRGARWLAVYSAPLSNDVVARTASHPEGPWSDPVVLFSAHVPSGAAYDAYLHPELASGCGELVVSYSRPTPNPFGSETVIETVSIAGEFARGSATPECAAP
ncbi:MAG TPA: DUF4185 domain-containing protein [Myxococcota bacterium]|jgi:hypothetical protein